jgi:glutamine synthetase
MFETVGVLSKRELESRYHIKFEMYTKMLQIEARVLGDMALNHIIPTAIKYQNLLLENVNGLKNILPEIEYRKTAAYQLGLIKEISFHIDSIQSNVTHLVDERRKANQVEDFKKKAFLYCDKVKPYFDIIRDHADKLEALIDDELWPLPKYRELLFIK